MLKKYRLLFPMNAIYSLFHFLLGFRVGLSVPYRTFDHVLLVNKASAVPENREYALSGEA
jgi:hypothetical protein